MFRQLKIYTDSLYTEQKFFSASVIAPEMLREMMG